MGRTLTVDVRDAIMDYLKSEERNLSWLHRKMIDNGAEISYSHLYFIISEKQRTLTEENLNLINEVLGTDFKL